MSASNQNNSDPPDDVELQQWIDRVADVFEQEWKNSPAPSITPFLEDSAGERRRILLYELLRVDLEHRFRRGDSVRLEDYLDEFPELSTTGEGLPDELIMFTKRLAERHGSGSSLRDDLANAASAGEPKSHTVKCPHCNQPVSVCIRSSDRSTVCPQCAGSIEFDATDIVPGAKLRLPRTLGKFQLLEYVGSGSFGTVFKARDSELSRIVAIKFPRPGVLGAGDDEQRFLREARATAVLRHPNIVQLYEVGREEGVPYIVSDFVDGRTLADFITESPLSHRECVELICTIAQALHHAHVNGVIHRDVKPSNILVDENEHAFVADFGLASQAHDRVQVTIVDGEILGTPAYMSPEQAMGATSKVDARSDVFSLGVVLYEMLTGERLFRGNVRAVLQQVTDADPRPLRVLNDHISRNLETICLKALAKSPTRRYQSANEFADDLGRFLNDEPILARPVGILERTWQWCRRNRRLAGTYASAAVIIMLVTAVAFFRVNDARKTAVSEKDKAEGLAVELTTSLETSEDLRVSAERQTRRAMSSRLVVESQHEPEVERKLLLAIAAVETTYSADREVVPIAHQNLRDVLSEVEGWPLSPDNPVTCLLTGDDRRWATTGYVDGTVRILDLQQSDPYEAPIVLPGLSGEVTDIDVSPDRRLLVASSGEERMSWSIEDALLTNPGDDSTDLKLFPGRNEDTDCRVVLLKDQTRRTVTFDGDGAVRVWNLKPDRSSNCILTVQCEEFGSPNVNGPSLSADGRWLMIAASSMGVVMDMPLHEQIRLFDLSTTDSAASPLLLADYGDGITDAHLDPSGRWAAAHSRSQVSLWDLTEDRPRQTVFEFKQKEALVRDIVLDRQGQRMLITSYNDDSVLYDLTGAEPANSARNLAYDCELQEFSANGKWLAGAHRDTLQLWLLEDPEATPIEVPCHGLDVRRIAFTNDSGGFICEWSDGTIRRHDLNTDDPLANVLSFDSWEFSMLQAGQAQWIIRDGEVPRMIHAENRDLREVHSIVLKGHMAIPDEFAPPEMFELQGEIRNVQLDHAGHYAFTEGADYTVRVWNLSETNPSDTSLVLQQGPNPGLMAASADGKWLALSGSATHEIRLCRIAKPLNADSLKNSSLILDDHQATIEHALFSADSKHLVSADSDGTIYVWNMEAAEITNPVGEIVGLGDIRCMALDAGSGRLVVGAETGVVTLWQLSNGDFTNHRQFAAHPDAVSAVDINGSHSQLLTVGADGQIKIWSLNDSEQKPLILTLNQSPFNENTAMISSDGRWVAARELNSSVHIWDLTQENPEIECRQISGSEFAFDPTGRWLVCGNEILDLLHPEPFSTPVSLQGHESFEVVSIGVSGNSQFLATGSRDGTARIWPLGMETLLDHAKRAAGRELTSEEKEKYVGPMSFTAGPDGQKSPTE